MRFISDLVSEIEIKEYKKTIYIDSSQVENVTVDALIYLIAIMKNDKINVEMNYLYAENLPFNEKAKKVYQESGFLDYHQLYTIQKLN